MKCSLLAAFLVILSACSKDGLPKPQERDGPAPRVRGADGERLTMEAQAVDLRLFDDRPTGGAPRKPTFWVHAEVFALEEDDIWSFEKARAVIYGRDAKDELITLEAGQGRFQETKMAYLEGDIIARVHNMTLKMQDIEWINEEGVARTDSPLSVRTETSHLKASSLRLYPDEKRLVMTDVSGLLEFGGVEP